MVCITDHDFTQNCYMDPVTSKPGLVACKQNGTDHTAHLRILVCTFVIHYLISIIAKLVSREISVFHLVYVAELACCVFLYTNPFV